ncbi:MAG: hypothetical protein WBM00_11925, partial [Solirubrobacterales bacterium]
MSVFEDGGDLSRVGAHAGERPSASVVDEGFVRANQTMQPLEADQALAERLLSVGVDGIATIVQMQATGKSVD